MPSYPDIQYPILEASGSLQETPRHYSSIAVRSVSVPSTSAQGLATSQRLSARSLSITWGKDYHYWKWVEREGSRYVFNVKATAKI
jgi:hypothetical protein